MNSKFLKVFCSCLFTICIFISGVRAQSKLFRSAAADLNFVPSLKVLYEESALLAEVTANYFPPSSPSSILTFVIKENLNGSFSEDTIIITSKADKSFGIPSFTPGESYIVFFHNKDGYWTITQGLAGSFSAVHKSDLILLQQRFNTNPHLFKPEGIEDLKNVFWELTSKLLKQWLFNDFRNLLTEDDLPFLKKLLASGDVDFMEFGIFRIGHLRIESMRLELERLLEITTNNTILRSLISALALIRNTQSGRVILPFINHESVIVRNAAISAVGTINYVVALNPLRALYSEEEIANTRERIINSVLTMSSHKEVVAALKYFLSLENNEKLTKKLVKNITELEKFITIIEQVPGRDLSYNYPNPFNPSTKILINLHDWSHVTLIIYNSLGQKVRVLLNGTGRPGLHEFEWKGLNDRGVPLGSGVYIYRLTVGGRVVSSKRMSLIR